MGLSQVGSEHEMRPGRGGPGTVGSRASPALAPRAPTALLPGLPQLEGGPRPQSWQPHSMCRRPRCLEGQGCPEPPEEAGAQGHPGSWPEGGVWLWSGLCVPWRRLGPSSAGSGEALCCPACCPGSLGDASSALQAPPGPLLRAAALFPCADPRTAALWTRC